MNKSFFIKALIALVIAWLLFSVGKTLYENWRVNKEVLELNNQIEELRSSTEEMKNRILYYQSPSYREKIARERFGLQKPGEEVAIIIPENKPKEIDEQKSENLPNYRKWWNFFFGS